MARMALIAVCLLLVGVWVHPYMSGAFESHRPVPAKRATSPAVDVSTIPQSVIDAGDYQVLRGVEGYWRIGQTDKGVWWFVSPEGKREFLNTVTTVQPFQAGRDENGVHFVSRDWNGSVGKYDGDLKAWAEKTLVRVREAGFKGLGAWCHPVFHELDVPMTRDLNVWKHYGTNYRLYSADWEATGDKIVAGLVGPFKNNKNLIGYFTDNELDWSDASVGPSKYFDGLPQGDPNRAKVIETVRSLWPHINDFNRDWKANYASFDELAALDVFPRDPADQYAKLFSVWLENLATDYFRITSQLVRKHDPNHLLLGVRFAGYAPKEVVRASKHYTDAQSVNYYVADGLLDPDMFSMVNRESGQPILITEYAFHALDNRSGARNTFGFQAQVPDQKARADGYSLFTQGMAGVPYIIGADWFQWSDEPASGRSSDGEDVNFGVVDVDDLPYTQLTNAIRTTAPKLNPLHAVSHEDTRGAMWRDSFAQKPLASVKKLDHPISINGNLRDWSEANRLPGVRTTQTVGIDRMDQRQPHVYMGWREEGMYVAFEVFDDNIETVAANGRWWTRDNIEFWGGTRRVATDQQGDNAFCHQFFFVPNARPYEGVLGEVGQWHRPGDSIKENLIPHPTVKHQARVLPDRYVVEMFIPGTALHGWDPVNQPELAFNLHVRNFHLAADYFWSAPKEATTQLRPNTWGRLVLARDEYAKK